MNALIQQLATAVREDKVDEAPNLAAWGLEPPQEVITLTRKDNKVYKLNLGKVNSNNEIYALDPYAEAKKPMVVQKSRLSDALKSLDDFRDAELLASAVGDLQSVKLTEGKDTVAWKKDERGHWQYTDPKGYGEAQSSFEQPPPPGGPVLTPGSMQTVLNDITDLKVEKGAKGGEFIDDVSDFKKYGLDQKDDKVFEITVTASGQRTLLVGKKVDDKGDKYYARLRGQNTVVKVAAKDIDPLRKLLDDKEALRDKVLVQMDGPPSAVNIKNAYGLIELRRLPMPAGVPDAGHWTLWTDGTSASVDPKVIQAQTSLVNLLRQKSPPLIDAFSDLKLDSPEAGFDKNSEVVELWNDADGVKKEEEKGKKPELKSKEPTYRLTFGKVIHEGDKDLVFVKREAKRADGGYDVTLVQIPRLALDEAKKGPLDYVDKKIPPFYGVGESVPPGWGGVTKLTIKRGNTTVEVAREKDDAPWKMVLPKDEAGRPADKMKVESVLRMMNGLQAQRLVAQKATDAELEKDYGLKSPQVTVEITMTKDGKPVTYTYDFGKQPKPDSDEVYAKQSQRPTIFTASKPFLDALPTDLLDPIVFTFDVTKAKKVTLTGWEDLVGSPVKLEFEKKDKTWEVLKGLPKDKFDAAKLNKLLDELHDCRAASFVAFKSGPKPEYKLDGAKGALVIEITVEGEEKPITLTVGGLDGDKGYFCMSNKSDGDVFLLPRSIFDGPKSKPLYFSRLILPPIVAAP